MNRIDLDIADLQELDYSEAQNLNGGIGFFATIAAGIIIGAAVAVIND